MDMSGHKLQVKNTFLDVFDEQAQDDDDDQPVADRRPRAHTDITDLKVPRKVSYSMDDPTSGAEEGPSVGSGAGLAPMSLAGLTADVGCGSTLPCGGAGTMPGLLPPDGAGLTQLGAGSFPPGYGIPGLPGLPGMPPWPPFPGAGLPPYPGLPGGLLGGAMGPGGFAYPPWAASSAQPSSAAASSASHHQHGTRQPNFERRAGGRGRGGRDSGSAAAAAAAAAAGAERAGPSGWSAQGPSKAKKVVESSPSGRTGRGGSGGRGRGSGRGADTGGAEKQEVEARELPLEQRTTVMLRNIPNRYTQMMLLQLLDEKGFVGTYDFAYLPMDFRNGVNLGYAFVNSLQHDDALRVTEVFHGFTAWCFDSAKVCEVSWAHPHQGLHEHVERYRNSPVMHPTMPEEYKPMVFKDGQRAPFPPPTKAIRAPKLRAAPLDKGPADKAANPAVD